MPGDLKSGIPLDTEIPAPDTIITLLIRPVLSDSAIDSSETSVDEEYLAVFLAKEARRETNDVKFEALGRKKASAGSTNVVDATNTESLAIIVKKEENGTVE